MQCHNCHGKGRVVSEAIYYRGGVPAATVPEIALCIVCMGSGVLSCCEGSQSDLAPLERVVDSMPCECNPNEDIPTAS